MQSNKCNFCQFSSISLNNIYELRVEFFCFTTTYLSTVVRKVQQRVLVTSAPDPSAGLALVT
jgi:hypothetical protein